jgi:RNA polymerase-binding transcription factor DksA
MALTQQQTQELHKAIERRIRELIDELRDDIARVRNGPADHIGGPARDPGDESVAMLIADLDRADLGRDLSELRALEAARQRIADGSYGSCVDCGGDIDYERLRVNPAALRDVRCQTQHEKTFGTATAPTL